MRTEKRFGRFATALVALSTGAALLFGPSSPALAEPPVEIDSIVTDTTNTLGGRDITAVEEASEKLRKNTGLTFYLVVVKTFESPTDGFEWAGASIKRSQLGESDVVLYVGEDVREYGLSIDHSVDISDSDRREIENSMYQDISSGRYTAAAVLAAGMLDDTIRRDEIAAERAAAISTTLGVGAVGTVALGGTMYAVGRRRKKNQAEAEAARRAASFKERSDHAGSELVRMDNLIRSSEEELQFAQAQFGSEATEAFAEAVSTAKARAQQAFALQAKLFDHIPDTEAEQDQWLEEIVELTQTTGHELSEQQAVFVKLQQRQSQVPQLVSALEQRLPAVRERAGKVKQWSDTLEATLDAEAITPIRSDLDQCERMIALFEEELNNARSGWDAGKQGAAVVDVTDAESALKQATDLLDALEQARERILDAPAAIGAKLRNAEQLLGQLQNLERREAAVIDADERATMSKARADLDAVSALNGAYRNPIHITSKLATVEDSLQRILNESLDEKTKLDQARASLSEMLSDARVEIGSTERYINSYRGGLSSAPRARLAQAQSQLERAQAVQVDDPVQAVEFAREAVRLARTAYSDAEDEIFRYSGNDEWVRNNFGDPNESYWPRYRNRRYSGSSDASDIAGAIIGGIIGGLLNNAGSSYRSSSGSWSSGRSHGGGRSSDSGGWSSTGGFR